MKQKLDHYVGRIVRLNQQAFQEICRHAKNQGEVLENCFLVAQVGRGVRQLVCYGANLRITVGVADVVFI
ncbi:MAG: hypothetical protein H6R15_1945 [Proteobacteria bacterium]|nr:hypothetical protein [Pseudomonadota bacterium]